MGPTTALRRALKARFFAHLSAEGFAVDTRQQPGLTTCRRARDGRVEILDLQWDTYGRPRFAVHFGTCPAEGLEIRGERFAAGDVLASWCPDRGTLRPRRGGWFRQDRAWPARRWRSPREPADVVDELLDRLPELEAYWRDGSLGPSLRLWDAAATSRS
jgi:hypothetical protein